MNWKLIAVVSIGLILRLVWLGKLPLGFTADEAGQGYSAYSLLKTGRDEWGQWWPLFPRSFGDYKPPLYTFLTVPTIAVFGLNEWAVRLPEVIVGVASIWVVYLLAEKLFSKQVALWAAFLLAVSPWAVQLSRQAWEGGLGILFFALGWYLWLKQKPYLGAILWGINLYSYHSWRFVTLAFVGLVIFNQRRKLPWKPALVFGIFLLPILFNIKQSLTRASDVSILSRQNVTNYFADKGTSPAPYLLGKALDNKYWYIAKQFWFNYTTYYSPTFFFTGNRPDSSHLNFPKTPLLYLVELPTLAVGAYLVFISKMKNGWLLLAWALLAAVPAALTEGWSAQRAIPFLPLVTIISAVGMENLFSDFLWKKLILAGLALGFISFIYTYIYVLPAKPIYSQRAQYKQVFTVALINANKFESVHFSKAFSVPQIFVAFYSQWDPTNFQTQSQDWLRYEKADKKYVDQLESYNLGKFEFHDLNWSGDNQRQNALLIGEAKDFPEQAKSIADILDNQGHVIYRLVPSGQSL